jgi:hypothetical protein
LNQTEKPIVPRRLPLSKRFVSDLVSLPSLSVVVTSERPVRPKIEKPRAKKYSALTPAPMVAVFFSGVTATAGVAPTAAMAPTSDA